MHPVSGIITVKTSGGPSWDRELVARHHLTVEARDDLGHGNRNTVQLVVNIHDVNDNPPVFAHSRYEARLRENDPDFEMPLKVDATDADLNGKETLYSNYFRYIIFSPFLFLHIILVFCPLFLYFLKMISLFFFLSSLHLLFYSFIKFYFWEECNYNEKYSFIFVSSHNCNFCNKINFFFFLPSFLLFSFNFNSNNPFN